MKITKIVSDGTVFGTTIYDENGDIVDNIVKVEWLHGVSDFPKARITFDEVAFEARDFKTEDVAPKKPVGPPARLVTHGAKP